MKLLTKNKLRKFTKKNLARKQFLQGHLNKLGAGVDDQMMYLPSGHKHEKHELNQASFSYKSYLQETVQLGVSELNYIAFVGSKMLALFPTIQKRKMHTKEVVAALAEYHFRTHGRMQVFKHLQTDPESNPRSIQLVGAVNAETIKCFEKELHACRSSNPFCMPVSLKLISPGGSAELGRGVVAEIFRTDCPVWTIAQGMAASMAAILWLAGDKRFVGEFAEIMLHRAHTAPGVAFPQGESDLRRRLRSMEDINKLLFEVIGKMSDRKFLKFCKKEIGGEDGKLANEDLTLVPVDTIEWGLIDARFGILGMSDDDAKKRIFEVQRKNLKHGILKLRF
jgi:ATP-dependent protease ClpP protease subunit|tara:strand:+ start:238 stop:1248 length:1011 start_codon:yes stop_codon:yes gene_type:complete